MSKIFEIFGYRLEDDSQEAQQHRSMAWCPFMNSLCDGGGNRYSTMIELTNGEHEELRSRYPELKKLMPGVCSLQVENNKSPWIVCPRRLLALGRENKDVRQHGRQVENKVMNYLNYPSSTKLGVWSEVNLIYRDKIDGNSITFDYAFDYVIMPLKNIELSELMEKVLRIENSPRSTRSFIRLLTKHGYQIENNVVLDFPLGKPAIIEIMTSSTSGSNKINRTQIAQAFEDALIGRTHTAPGINYRQVWSRMVGQLFVKSEVASAWGGSTIWVLQDRLVEYMDATTRLDMSKLIRETIDEVNILSFSYPDKYSEQPLGVVELSDAVLYAGKIAATVENDSPNFIDIVRAAVLPPYVSLLNNLIIKGPAPTYLEVQ